MHVVSQEFRAEKWGRKMRERVEGGQVRRGKKVNRVLAIVCAIEQDTAVRNGA